MKVSSRTLTFPAQVLTMLATGSLLLASFPIQALAATSPSYTRLFYFQDGPSARKSFYAHASSIDIFAPQSYGLNASGKLLGSVSPALLTFAKQHGIKVMPLVTNSAFSTTVYQAILDDPTKQALAIQALVDEAKKQGYWGWQIDFEQMDVSDSAKFTAFVTRAHTAMRENGLQLSVAVISKISDNPSDYPNNLWEKLIGVYDYSALAANTDFISVMSYDDPNSKGPVAEYPWLQQVVAYSVAHIPREKISMGIPFYYWQWNDTLGKRVGIGGNSGIQAVLNKHKVALHYSATEQAPYMTYTSKSKNFTIWYENAQSIAQKIALLKANGLAGFSGWALGLELANVYSAVNQ